MKSNQMNSVQKDEKVTLNRLKKSTKISLKYFQLVEKFQPDENSSGWHDENVSWSFTQSAIHQMHFKDLPIYQLTDRKFNSFPANKK